MKNKSMKGFALKYAEMGFCVFPVKTPGFYTSDNKNAGKEPYIRNWQNDATTDSKIIEEWWAKWPDANIGIVTGMKSRGLVVIDLDIDEEKGKNGIDVLSKWQNEHAELPETKYVLTGRGGWHLYYFDDKPHKSCVGLYEGVDIRGEGGFIIAPPSLHRNGNRYEWEASSYECEFARVDDNVREFLKGEKSIKNDKQSDEERAIFQMPDEIPEGMRTSTLVRLIGSLKSKGLSDEAIRVSIRTENQVRCIPPLTDKELEKEIFPAITRKGWKTAHSYVSSVCDHGKARPVKREFQPIQAVTAAQLDKMELPPVEWLVDNILTVGLSAIGAPPKSYKSFMALDLCAAICTGTTFLGFKTHQHACLYFDLESTKGRPKNRLNLILGKDTPKPDNLYIITGDDEPGRIGDGFETQVEYQLQQHPDIKLIVVDVFQKIRIPKKGQNGGYDNDYEDLGTLKSIIDKHGVGLLLIHHSKKAKDISDPFNNMSGSAAIMGALDCAWVIEKDKRSDNEATLHITGRDLAGEDYTVKFNQQVYRWEMVGTAEDIAAQRARDEYDQSPIVETIKRLLKQGDGYWKGTITDIISACDIIFHRIPDETPQQISLLLNKWDIFLQFDGINHDIKRSGRNRWHIFNVTAVTDVTNVINVTAVTDD